MRRDWLHFWRMALDTHCDGVAREEFPLVHLVRPGVRHHNPDLERTPYV